MEKHKPEGMHDRVWQGGVTIEPEDPCYSRVLQRLSAAKQAKRKLSRTRVAHLCHKNKCHPENESDLIRQGLLKGPPLTKNVYLCDMGAVHVCTARSCELYGNSFSQVCHISGLQTGNIYSSYSSDDSRTWYSRPEYENRGSSKKTAVFVQESFVTGSIDRRRLLSQSGSMISAMRTQRKQAAKRQRQRVTSMPEQALPPTNIGNTAVAEQPKPAPLPSGKAYKRIKRTTYNKPIPMSTVKLRAEKMVRLLLFSSCRQNLNQKMQAKHEKEACDARDTYIKGCMEDGQFGFATDIYRLMADKLSAPLPLDIFVFDESLFNYYVDVICQVWRLVTKYYVHPKHKQYDEDTGEEIFRKVNVDHVCIGVLYSMRLGWKFNKTFLLPQDNFLFCHLPRINDLTEFDGISKPACTSGSSILKTTYENAVNQSVPLSELTLKVEHLKETMRYENGKEVDTLPKVFLCKSRKVK